MFSFTKGHDGTKLGWAVFGFGFYYLVNWPSRCKCAGTPWSRWFYEPTNGWIKLRGL